MPASLREGRPAFPRGRIGTRYLALARLGVTIRAMRPVTIRIAPASIHQPYSKPPPGSPVLGRGWCRGRSPEDRRWLNRGSRGGHGRRRDDHLQLRPVPVWCLRGSRLGRHRGAGGWDRCARGGYRGARGWHRRAGGRDGRLRLAARAGLTRWAVGLAGRPGCRNAGRLNAWGDSGGRSLDRWRNGRGDGLDLRLYGGGDRRWHHSGSRGGRYAGHRLR
jgi:hypothetical protein